MRGRDDAEDHGEAREQTLVAYLAGELPPQEHQEADDHIVGCNRCWREVQLARAGRAAARASGEALPDTLQARLAATVARASVPPVTRLRRLGTSGGRRRRLTRRIASAAVVAVAVAASFVAGVTVDRHVRQPSQAAPATAPPGRSSPGGVTPGTPAVLIEAADGFDRGRLPGTRLPADPAPDLLDLGLHVMAAGTGDLAQRTVTAYVYADADTGEQVFVYRSARQFDALVMKPGQTTGTRSLGDLTVFVAASPHPMLVLGTDPGLVVAVGERLA